MNSLEKYYLLTELHNFSQYKNIPDTVQKVIDANAFGKNIELFCNDTYQYLKKHTLEDNQDFEVYCGISHVYLLLNLFLGEYQTVKDGLTEIFDRKLKTTESLTQAQHELCNVYRMLLHNFVLRKGLVIPIELFEEALDEINWGKMTDLWTSRISFLVGYSYWNEDLPDLQKRCKHWFDQACRLTQPPLRFIIDGFTVYYYIYGLGKSPFNVIENKLNLFQQAVGQHQGTTPSKELLFELNVRLQVANLARPNYTGDKLKLLSRLTEAINDRLARLPNQDVVIHIHYHILAVYAFLALEKDKKHGVDQGHYKSALTHIEMAEKMAMVAGHENLMARCQALHGQVHALGNNSREANRYWKEASAYFKKHGLFIDYANVVLDNATLLARQESYLKAYELTLDLMRFGLKNLDNGGFAVITKCWIFLNRLFLDETQKPSVSWMVDILYEFFMFIEHLNNVIEGYLDNIGLTQFNAYMEAFKNFKPITMFNLRVYLLYQHQSVKMLYLSALLKKDTLSASVAQNQLETYKSQFNPLSFTYATWSDFKDIPYDVRNKVLNHCITIAKGDLPRAADHLNFSYRNLRSYITCSQVDRLGFFLQLEETNQKKLELGVRLILYDMYLSGKIFEVVFDIPRFLVEHANQGFLAGEFEDKLRIKYNTAKKYLKIMVEFGLISLDTNASRKNFYQVCKDNILTRYQQHKENPEAIKKAERKPETVIIDDTDE